MRVTQRFSIIISFINILPIAACHRLPYAEQSTIQLLQKSGTKIGHIGATIGGVNATITLHDAGWDFESLSGEDKEDLAIKAIGVQD